MLRVIDCDHDSHCAQFELQRNTKELEHWSVLLLWLKCKMDETLRLLNSWWESLFWDHSFHCLEAPEVRVFKKLVDILFGFFVLCFELLVSFFECLSHWFFVLDPQSDKVVSESFRKFFRVRIFWVSFGNEGWRIEEDRKAEAKI